MPDIDMDFVKQEEVKLLIMLFNNMGEQTLHKIITFGKLLAKGVIRDVARVLDMPYAKVDVMAKLIPDELGINLTSSYEKEPKIKELCDSDPQAASVWEYALAL